MTDEQAEAICRATGWEWSDDCFLEGLTYREPDRSWNDADAALLAWMRKHRRNGVGISRVTEGFRVYLGEISGSGRTLALAACDALAEFGRAMEQGRALA